MARRAIPSTWGMWRSKQDDVRLLLDEDLAELAGSVTERTCVNPLRSRMVSIERDIGWLVIDDEHLGSTKQSLLKIQSAAPRAT